MQYSFSQFKEMLSQPYVYPLLATALFFASLS